MDAVISRYAFMFSRKIKNHSKLRVVPLLRFLRHIEYPPFTINSA